MRCHGCDIAIVGAGPAGLAAAQHARRAGKDVVLVDEGWGLGGQIWRPSRSPSGPPLPRAARILLERVRESGVRCELGVSLHEILGGPDAWLLRGERARLPFELTARKIIVAAGAKERFLPFSGWTLPGVMGSGGAQALVKGGWDVTRKRVVIAGSGPLLWPVAATLVRKGAVVARVAEQASFESLLPFGAALALHPHKVLEALQYMRSIRTALRTGWWVSAALGDERVEAAVLTDGQRTETVPCEVLGVSYGLVPNLELARLLGVTIDEGAVRVDSQQQTSVRTLYAAGESCGIAGVDVALIEGGIAGLAASGQPIPPQMRHARARGRRLAAAMDRAFALRAEITAPPGPDTIICRCEDVRIAQLNPTWSIRQAKLYTRLGMGACQGRVCGPAVACFYGWAADSARSPVKPVALTTL